MVVAIRSIPGLRSQRSGADALTSLTHHRRLSNPANFPEHILIAAGESYLSSFNNISKLLLRMKISTRFT